MLFLARMDVNFPSTLSADEITTLKEQERLYSGELQHSGRMKGIWRVVGEYSNYSIYDVESNDALHRLFEDFPMYKYMSIHVTPLAEHPNRTAATAY